MSREDYELTLIVSACCALDIAVAQLFPFSPLKHYIDQRYADLEDTSTTNSPAPLERYRYAEDTIAQVPNVNRVVVDEEEVKTVVVTPKPKYTPHRLVPEPNVDPNTRWIPNIGYNGPSLPSLNQPTPQPSSVNVLTKFPETPLEKHSPTSTIVESIPSLSVTIPLDRGERAKASGIIDYLIPPKYPSVYEDHFEQNEISPVSTAPIKLLTSQTTSTTQKPKKPKRKRPYKDYVRGSEKNASSEKRVRKRFRPSRTRTTSTAKPPPLEEPNASATSFFQSLDVKPHFGAPMHVSNFYPQGSEAIGLGSSGGERVEFQLHGQSGPDSYKFGFDTGDVKNRHFRYEEKDNHGNVKGHYGYYDRNGKLQIINYHADENGFHATSPQ